MAIADFIMPGIGFLTGLLDDSDETAATAANSQFSISCTYFAA